MSLIPSLSKLFETKSPVPRRRIRLDTGIAPVFVIGDVHGRIDLLRMLVDQIGSEGRTLSEWPYIVLVGDLIDRGDGSAQVIDFVREMQVSNERLVCLCGNHEALMLDFLEAPSLRHEWLGLGGTSTLISYGVDLGRVGTKRLPAAVLRAVPTEHIEFLRDLPSALETTTAFISHAGINPDRPLSDQTDRDLLWYRDGMASDYGNQLKLIVHGHDAIAAGSRMGQRVNVDSGAYATGTLTAVRIDADQSTRFVTASVAARAFSGVN